MVNCGTAARFPVEREANVVRRKLKGVYILARVQYCGTCDGYHLDASESIKPLEMQVLRLLAQGYTANVIWKDLGITRRSVYEAVHRLYSRFYASNGPQLACIAMSLGILDPSGFVPTLKERTHG